MTLNCRYCGNENVIRHGNRKTKNGPRQIYLCRDCDRVFSGGTIPYLNTRSDLVLRGITLYNQGYSLGQCSSMLRTSFDERIPRNTLHYWTKRYSDTFPYLKIREKRGITIPLLPKVYGNTVFSLHRRKIELIPDDMGTLKNYIARASRGIHRRNIGKGALDSFECGRFDSIMDHMDHSKDTVESRILRLALESNEIDPIRFILINDSRSICRNLPLYLIKNGKEYSGFIDLVQYWNDRIHLISKSLDGLESEQTLKHLIASGLAMLQRTDLKPERIGLGAFDIERKWSLDLDFALKELGLTPKSN